MKEMIASAKISRKLLVETNALPDHLQMSIMNLFEMVTRTQRMNQEHLRPRFMVNSNIKCQLPKCHLAVKPTTHPLVCSCLSELPLVIGSSQLSEWTCSKDSERWYTTREDMLEIR